ncbi:MAG: hypothetical protein KatS3mg090_0951 [Patescibacteria group bacterium]|nr:MAG: hypothetical protein KatS3mg090_0951 [Patescibacteria group bacterium]
MKTVLNNKNLIYIVSAFIAVVVLVSVFIMTRSDNKNSVEDQPKVDKLDQFQLPADTSANVEKLSGNRINLIILNIPDNTETIEYEITYITKDDVTQGVIGTISNIDSNEIKKEIFLGTCSSGSCVPHTVKDKISVFLKFTGSYGSGSLEKEFDYNSL